MKVSTEISFTSSASGMEKSPYSLGFRELVVNHRRVAGPWYLRA